MDEGELLNRYAQTGDQEAFAKLVEEHGDWVYAAARRQLGDEHLAQDVTQAAFLVLVKQARRLRGYRYASGWMFLALENCVKHAKRQRARLARREREAASMRKEAVEEARWEQIAPELEEAVGKLGKGDRDVVLLRFYQQKALADVGQCLGISEKAAQKRVERAVEKLRGILGKKGITGTTAGLSAVLVGNVVEKMPELLVEKIVSAVGSVGGNSVAAGIAKGAMKMMTMAKVKVAVCLVAGGALLIGVSAVAVEKPATTTAVQTPPSTGPTVRNSTTDEANRVLIGQLMQQNEDARRQIRTIKYQFERSSRSITAEGERLRTVTGSAQHSGKMRWVETSETVPDQDGRARDTVRRVVLNEGYSAFWVKGTRNPNLTRHVSIEQMSSEESERIAVSGGTDYLLWGFGLGEETWRQAYEKHPTVNRWTVEPVVIDSGRKAFCVSRFSPITRDRQKADMQFVIEPERGALITRVTWYSREGKLAGERKVEATQVSQGGPWVPVSMTETRYRTDEAPTGSSAGQVTQVTSIRLRDIEVNQPIPADHFTWEALDLADGVHLIEQAVNGDLSSSVYQDGCLFPVEDVEWEQRR